LVVAVKFELKKIKVKWFYSFLCCISFSDSNLCYVQPKKVMSFEDAKQRAWQWKKAIEGLQNR
jgi:hypothetical protein